MESKEKPIPYLSQLNEKMWRSGYMMLNKEFTRETVEPLIHLIVGSNLLPEDEKPERLQIAINSYGGEVNALIQLLDAMDASEIPIDTIVTGTACSCGCLLLMAGDKRYATKNSSVMSHQFSGGTGRQKEHELYSRMESFNMTSEFMVNHYKKHTKLSIAKIRKHLLGPTDVWLTAGQAKEYNIIDEVI